MPAAGIPVSNTARASRADRSTGRKARLHKAFRRAREVSHDALSRLPAPEKANSNYLIFMDV